MNDITDAAWTLAMVEADAVGFLSTLQAEHQSDVMADVGSSRRTELNQRWRKWAHEGNIPMMATGISG